MIKLVLSDMDNTIVPLGVGRVSDRMCAAVHACLDAGVRFAPATGRDPDGLERFFVLLVPDASEETVHIRIISHYPHSSHRYLGHKLETVLFTLFDRAGKLECHILRAVIAYKIVKPLFTRKIMEQKTL